MTYCVYQLEDMNGVAFYVGCTSSIKERLKHLRGHAKTGKQRVHHCIRSLKYKFHFRKLRSSMTRKAAVRLEKRLIAKMSGLCNIKPGGEGLEHGWQHTAEAKEKIAVAARGRTHSAESRLKMSIAQRGRVISTAHREKLSAAARQRVGWTHSAETRAKMSASQRGRTQRIRCPHCGKVGLKSGMARWHFNYCRQNTGR